MGVSLIVHGIVGDCKWFRYNRLTILIYVIAMSGINKICSIRANSYAHLAVFSAIDGFAAGETLTLVIWCYSIRDMKANYFQI